MSKMHTKAQDKVRQGYGAKNLTRSEAMRRYPYKKSMGDVRAFKYTPSTGRWVWT